ncbi:MAG: hypothetical protein EA001_11370 [Oscillatoriales cyanobacterium]|nr:MAG: hypothetical protein EA001_11370 [Oscillatoriales cyanobacterium]
MKLLVGGHCPPYGLFKDGCQWRSGLVRSPQPPPPPPATAQGDRGLRIKAISSEEQSGMPDRSPHQRPRLAPRSLFRLFFDRSINNL